MCRVLFFLVLFVFVSGCRKAEEAGTSKSQQQPQQAQPPAGGNTATPTTNSTQASTPRSGNSVRIPTVVITGNPTSQDPEKLAVTSGAADELPQGPTGFDVLGDGGFVIGDSLRRRLALFDSDGKYRSDIPLQFPPESVSVSDGAFEVRNAASGEVQRVATRGLGELLQVIGENHLDTAAAKLLGPGAGIISLGGGDGQLNIRYEQPGSRIVSIKGIARDGGSVYVALELTSSTPRADNAVDVKKAVLKFDRSGRLLVQIPDIPVNYFVHPRNEFRVRKGVVYQMAPLKEYVEIRSWDTKQLLPK